MVYMIESQIAHVMGAVQALRRSGARTIEVRRSAYDRYNAEVDERMQGTVWNTGCASWYRDATGRIATVWPDWTWRFRRRATQLQPADYALDIRVSEPVPA